MKRANQELLTYAVRNVQPTLTHEHGSFGKLRLQTFLQHKMLHAATTSMDDTRITGREAVCLSDAVNKDVTEQQPLPAHK